MASDEKQVAQNVAASTAAETEDENIVSMVDVLKEEEQLEEDAFAVLGAGDDKHCTYPNGYMKRQALYSCGTCSAVDETRAGVCLACSYACHEGHDLFELYTKRNFRCDCGNKKFSTLTCKLHPEKDDFNSDNKYNQNFDGVYCVCARPYPDPEDEVEDEMIQCVVCEDWYHGRHLGVTVPVNGDYQEMICTGCMSKHDFLWNYTTHSKETQVIKGENSTHDVDVDVCAPGTPVKDDKQDGQSEGATPDTVQSAATPGTSSSPVLTDKKEQEKSTEAEASTPPCKLKELQQREVTVRDCAVFWPDEWRNKLCRCEDCMKLYRDHGVENLCELSDTVQEYEQQGKVHQAPSSQHDREKQILEGMNRVQQIEMVQGFNDMKSALSDYLKHFAENRKVVRAEDIQEFFSQMQARKRQKTSQATPQYFCR